MPRSASAAGWRLIVLPLILAGSKVLAGVTVVDTQNSAGSIAFSETGTFLAAGNFTGPGDTRGSNVFQSETLAGNPPSQTWAANNGIQATLATTSTDNLAGIDLGSTNDKVFLTEIFSQNQSTETLKLSGLSAASSYLIQFPHGENRGYYYSAMQTFTDSNNNTASSLLNFGNAVGEQFAMITLAVSDSTSLTYSMPAGGRGPSFDGWDIRVVPEPMSMVLLFATLPLVRRQRRS